MRGEKNCWINCEKLVVSLRLGSDCGAMWFAVVPQAEAR